MTDSTSSSDDDRPAIAGTDGGHLGEDTSTSPFARPSGDANRTEQLESSAAEPAATDAATAEAATGHPTSEAPTEAQAGASFRRRERRGLLVPVVAAAVVAAVVGGVIGGAVVYATTPRGLVSTSASGSQGVVINNPSTATAVSAVAAKASPSVVTISVAATSESGTGSGIVLSSDGYVLTNNHVVTLDGDTSSGTISVTAANGRIYKASIVGTDPMNDLAVIKLQNASGLTAATFANSSDLNVGDAVVAIGAPLDLPNTVTTGIVSALNRSIAVASSAVQKGSGSSDSDSGGSTENPFNFWDQSQGQTQSQAQTANIYLSVLQTDAAINPGNSGGALLDSQGEVIGVNVAIAGTGSTTGGQSGSIGVGFSIPSNVAKRIADDLIAGKKATHGQLGVESPADQSTSTGTVAGVQVSGVTAGGAAAKAGLQKGDIITAVGKVAVTDYTDLAGQVRAYAGGSTVNITYSRDGAVKTTSVTLGSTSA